MKKRRVESVNINKGLGMIWGFIFVGFLLITMAGLSLSGLGETMFLKITGNAVADYNTPTAAVLGQDVTIPAGSAYTFNLPQAMKIESLKINLKDKVSDCEVQVSTDALSSEWMNAGNVSLENLGLSLNFVVSVRKVLNCSSLGIADIEVSGYSRQV